MDARPRHLFLGEEGVANTGHIPGSRCLPYQELVDGATGLWAAPEAVKRLVRDAGIDPDRPPRELIATCGSGVSATVALLSLERIGIHADGVYDGSFNEWSADSRVPSSTAPRGTPPPPDDETVITFCLVHGARHDDACWQPLAIELAHRRHECVTPLRRSLR